MKNLFTSPVRLLSVIATLAFTVATAWADTTNFTASGTYSWTAPAGVNSVVVECWGGGGTGGSARRPGGSNGYGGGGGGGAYAKATVTVTPGNTYTVSVGAGGSPTTATIAASGVNGASGTNSWFGVVATSTTNVLAVGGTGGQDAFGNAASGGAGATTNGCIGTTLFAGGSGRVGASPSGGGGGGSAGTASNGTAATSATGAAAVTGGGAGGTGGNVGGTKPGVAGSAPGGGGGGGTSSGSQNVGGTGGTGQVKLTYTVVYDHVNVETAADGSGTTVAAQNISAGSSITVYAIGRASDNSFMSNTPAVWSLANKTGAVVDGDLVASGDSKSAVFTAHLAGSANIRAVNGASTANNSGLITVPSTGVLGVWTNDVDGNWTDATKWNSNPSVPTSAGDTAVLGLGTALRTITLDANETVGVINMTNSNSFVIAGSKLLTLDNSGAGAIVSASAGSANAIQTPVALNDNAALTVSSGKSLAISGTISNTSAAKILTVNGAGTSILSVANTYGPASAGTVGTILTGGGTVQIGNSSALGSGDVTNSGSATIQAGGAGLNVANNIGIGSGATSTLDNNGNTFTVSGVISGGGSLAKIGSGTLTLGTANTYAGGTAIGGGVLSVATDGATAGNAADLGVVPASATANNIVLNGGDLLANTTLTLHANRGVGIGATSGSATATGLLDAASGATFTVNGTIASAGNTGVNNLTINSGSGNNGTVVLGGANTFNGTTIISNGTLQLANSSALASSTLNYSSGTLSFGSLTAATLAGLTGSQNLALVNGSSAAVALSVGSSSNSTYNGNLSGAGSLTKNGSGSFFLAGTNNYAGATTPSAGLLIITNGGVLNTVSFNIPNTSGAGITVAGGTLRVTNNSTVGKPSAGLTVTSGSATFSGALDFGNNLNASALIAVSGGTLSAASMTLGRNNVSTSSTMPGSGVTTDGLYINGGAVSFSGNLAYNNSDNSGQSLRMDSGSLTVGGTVTVALNNGGRWSVLDVNGGTLTVNNTATGILLGGTSAGNTVLLVRNGTVNAGKITMGQGAIAETNALMVSGGSLYLGSGGIVLGSSSGTVVTTNSFAGGTLGASADWSSSLAMQFGGTTIQCADASSVAHNITLSGVLSGSSGLTKTGNGTLSLNGANTYTGTTAVSAGKLAVNGSTAAGSALTLASGTTLGGSGTVNGSVTLSAGATLAPGNSIGTLTLAGTATLDAAATTVMELNRTNVQTADKVNKSGGTLTFAGTLTVTNVGETLQTGDAFDLFDGTLAGSFATLNLPNGASHWITSDLAAGGTITFTNNSPTANSFSVSRASGYAYKLKKSLLGMDLDGDALTYTIGTTTNGAALTQDANYIYVPASMVDDEFTYTVTESFGNSATGTVNLVITAATGQTSGSITTSGGNPTLTFFGIPGQGYYLQVSPDLGTWYDVANVTAGTNGLINYTDTNPPAPAAYYRLSDTATGNVWVGGGGGN